MRLKGIGFFSMINLKQHFFLLLASLILTGCFSISSLKDIYQTNFSSDLFMINDKIRKYPYSMEIIDYGTGPNIFVLAFNDQEKLSWTDRFSNILVGRHLCRPRTDKECVMLV